MFVGTIKRSESSSLAIVVPALIVLVAIAVTSCSANPLNLYNGYPNSKKQSLTVEIAEPEELINSLETLLQQIFQSMDYTRQLAYIQQKGSDKKRGIDLGLSRGFSGSQAAKHLMGMQAASFANGPGKRK